MRIETEIVAGYATCGRDRRSLGHCEGYTSREVPIEVERITTTFGDLSGNPSDSHWAVTSHEHEKLRPVNEQDWKCPACGAPANLSLQPRVEFPRLSEHSPNELVRRAELERARDQRDAAALSADERSARALEALAAGAGLTGESELSQLRAELAQVRALLTNGNGHAAEPEPDPPAETDPPAPRPRKSATP